VTRLLVRARLARRSQIRDARLLSERLVSARFRSLQEREPTAQTGRSLSSRKKAA